MSTSAPRIAAFFDIDGTLLPGPSLERQLLRYLRWRDELPRAAWLRWGGEFAKRVWRNPLAATDGNKAHYAGVRMQTIENFCSRLRRHRLSLIPAGLQQLEWHAAQGHRIVLASGTLRPLAECVAAAIAQSLLIGGDAASIHVVATELEACDSRLTGRTVGQPACGTGKAAAVKRVALQLGVDLAESFAYGDRFTDRWMLAAVGHPVAVNPAPSLRLLARRRGWLVASWSYPLAPSRRLTSQQLGATV